jgi:hypothetical protein
MLCQATDSQPGCVAGFVRIVWPDSSESGIKISESITVGTKPDVIEVSPTVLAPLWCRREIGKEF